MSQNRDYELVYIVSPETSEQDITDLHTQIEQIVQRFREPSKNPRTGVGGSWPTRSATTAKAPTSSRRSADPAT